MNVRLGVGDKLLKIIYIPCIIHILYRHYARIERLSEYMNVYIILCINAKIY